MKKLVLAVMLFAVLSLPAQDAPATPELTEVETLKVRLILSDIRLADQQMQIIQAQFQAALATRGAKQQEFQTMLAVLRKEHNAPEDKFAFDANTMTFTPIEQRPEPEPKEPEAEDQGD